MNNIVSINEGKIALYAIGDANVYLSVGKGRHVTSTSSAGFLFPVCLAFCSAM